MKLPPLPFPPLCAFLAMSVAGTDAAVQSAQGSFDAKIRPFIEKHCFDCHDSDTHKAGLRLDALPGDFHDEKTSATWVRVFDKLAAGEMPPKKRERPPQGELDAATRFLRAQLHAASLERQQKQGRVVVRRFS